MKTIIESASKMMVVVFAAILCFLMGCETTRTPYEKATGLKLPHKVIDGLEYCYGNHCPICNYKDTK